MPEIEIQRYRKTMALTIWRSREVYIGASAARAMGNPRRVATSVDSAKGDLILRPTDALSGFACRKVGGGGMAFSADSLWSAWEELFGAKPASGTYSVTIADGTLTANLTKPDRERRKARGGA